ncbi:MAG: class I SAM-dependent methyltransferase [Alphaproteobacteria bacterium]|nr:class I SAM-dependent methyltransferase [Alphaproteobacteria bacterium]
MPIIAQLVDLYRAEGIEISTGLPPHRFGGFGGAPFTWFLKDGKSLTNGLGIAMQEVYLLEHLFAAIQPRRALVIGNAFGWSTLAIAALLTGGRVVAIDSGADRNSLEGLDLTNRIATHGKLPAKAVRGVSPQDVASIVDAELGGPVDFAFIDGLHTSEQVVLDYKAVRAKAAPDAVYLFHDVQEYGLGPAIADVERLAGQMATMLWATQSGMAILFDAARHPELARAVAAFAPPESALKVVRQAAWDHRHRHIARWRRSYRKRLNRLRGLAGGPPPV